MTLTFEVKPLSIPASDASTSHVDLGSNRRNRLLGKCFLCESKEDVKVLRLGSEHANGASTLYQIQMCVGCRSHALNALANEANKELKEVQAGG